MKEIKQEKYYNVEIYNELDHDAISTLVIRQHRTYKEMQDIIIEKSSIEKVVQAITDTSYADWLIDYGNWLKIKDCAHDFSGMQLASYNHMCCRICYQAKGDMKRLNDLFGGEE